MPGHYSPEVRRQVIELARAGEGPEAAPHRERPASVRRRRQATIALKLAAAGRRQLKKARRLRLTAMGKFILPHAAPVTAKRRFTLRR
jgi:hypothetical protein